MCHFFSITSTLVKDVVVITPWYKCLISICFHVRRMRRASDKPQLWGIRDLDLRCITFLHFQVCFPTSALEVVMISLLQVMLHASQDLGNRKGQEFMTKMAAHYGKSHVLVRLGINVMTCYMV